MTLLFIQCISGRVHSAMVSKLNAGQRSVTVEWYERGETKGKEVELDMLLALNPDLLVTKPSFAAPQQPASQIQAPINLQRVS
jgi:kinesin family member 2/24